MQIAGARIPLISLEWVRVPKAAPAANYTSLNRLKNPKEGVDSAIRPPLIRVSESAVYDIRLFGILKPKHSSRRGFKKGNVVISCIYAQDFRDTLTVSPGKRLFPSTAETILVCFG